MRNVFRTIDAGVLTEDARVSYHVRWSKTDRENTVSTRVPLKLDEPIGLGCYFWNMAACDSLSKKAVRTNKRIIRDRGRTFTVPVIF